MQGGLPRWPTLGTKPWSWLWLWPWACRGWCWPPARLLSCMRLRLQTALAFASPAFSTLQRAAMSVRLHPVQACPASFLRSARSSSEACHPRTCLLHVSPPKYGLRIPVFASVLQVLPLGLPVPICICPPASFGLAKRKGLPCTPSGEGASRRLAAFSSSSAPLALACVQRRAWLRTPSRIWHAWPWPALKPPAPQPRATHSGGLNPKPCLRSAYCLYTKPRTASRWRVSASLLQYRCSTWQTCTGGCCTCHLSYG